MGSTLLTLIYQHPDIKQLLFPDADSSIDLQELMKLVDYDVTDDNYKFAAKQHMEKYLNVLSERGKTTMAVTAVRRNVGKYFA
jgi:hypothetical protein